MANGVNASLIAQAIQSLTAPLQNVFSGHPEVITEVQNLLTSIEANIDNPVVVARFANDITTVQNTGVQTKLLADKIVQLAQTTPYNPAYVMAEVNAILSLLAQSTGSLWTRIGLASTTTP